uniref:epoxide hydrolase family protein n=1 Tax=Herbidospora sakaeratensis TaxID=564415 RepID=UPI001C3F2FAA|nr:epoxide hydrolase [Herbidospora sakaeratensis]
MDDAERPARLPAGTAPLRGRGISERRLNALPQFRTTLDGLGVHFVHVRSPHENALPLVLTHGWPGSIVEFLKVIGPLTDPPAHGGDAADAFHVVCPSLPGYGSSDKPAGTGWGVERIAAAWVGLMARLRYDRYGAQGGDWGTRASAGRTPSTWRASTSCRPRPGAALAALEPTTDVVTAPAGCSIFPKENPRPSRRWAAKRFTDIRHWNELDRGGHFAAFEQPEAFVDEVRTFFRLVH